jgi:hypothetical protein
MIDRAVAMLDTALIAFAGERDESDYMWMRESMARHADWRDQDAFLDRQLEAIDSKIMGLLIHCSIMIAVAALIGGMGVGLVVALPATLVASLFAVMAAALLRSTRLFGSHDFLAGEELSPEAIQARMSAQIMLRKNFYRRALRIATVATLAFVPLLVLQMFAVALR